jgi:hypothetical protein
MTLSLKAYFIALSRNDTQHKRRSITTICPYAECRYAECRYAECRYAECCGSVLKGLRQKLQVLKREKI